MTVDSSNEHVPQPFSSWRLDGRTALVTGASSGLGARFVRVLHSAGARVVATARRADLLEGVAEEHGFGVEVVAGDITDKGHREALAHHLRSSGGLDILVNNAGVSDDGFLEDQELEELTRVVDVNLISVLDLCRLTGPLLLSSKHGTVVNVASMYGLVASKGPMVAYNATKAAVVNMTRSLAAQWGARGVRVNALAPGYFPTEMTGHLSDEAFRRSVASKTLLGRVPVLSELDGPLLFLASDASSYITGHTLVVDGGWTAI